MSNKPKDTFSSLCAQEEVQQKCFDELYKVVESTKYGIQTKMKAIEMILDRSVAKVKSQDVDQSRGINIFYVSPQIGAQMVLNQARGTRVQGNLELPSVIESQIARDAEQSSEDIDGSN